MKQGSRAVIYCRMSQDRSGEGVGTARQQVDCEDLAQREGLRVIEVVKDNDVSAFGRKKRPGWDAVVELVRTNSVDAIVCWHVDRLYRHPRDLEALLDLVERSRLRIHTVKGGTFDLNDSNGQMVARMLGAAARQEVQQKAVRQAREKQQRAMEGRYNGGRRPLGFEADGVTICEEEAEALRDAAARILAGHRLAEVTRHVSEVLDYPNKYPKPKADGAPRPPAGKPLKSRVLRDALTSPRIVGRRQYWSVVERQAWDQRRRAGEVSGDRPRDVVEVEAEWPPILDYETYLAVRTRLLDPARRSSGRRPVKSLLSGVITCASCGTVMGYSTSSYKCMTSVGGCGAVSVTSARIEEKVLEEVGVVLEDTRLELLEPEPLPDMADDRTRIKTKLAEVPLLWQKGVISTEQMESMLSSLEAEAQQLDAEEDEVVRRNSIRRAVALSVDDWQAAERAEQAQVIRTLIDKIVIQPTGKRSGPKFRPDRYSITWKV
jgi:site-specific DNA recombinase